MTVGQVEWPRELPMFPLGSVALPGVGLPLHVFEPRYRALVLTCLMSDHLFGSVLIERGSEVGGGDSRSDVGTLLRIVSAEESADGRWAIVGVGTERLRVLEWRDDDPFPRCLAEPWPDGPQTSETADRLEQTRRATQTFLERIAGAQSDTVAVNDLDPDPSIASFQLAAILPLGPLDRLTALRAPDPDSRLSYLLETLNEQTVLLDALDALDGGPDESN